MCLTNCWYEAYCLLRCGKLQIYFRSHGLLYTHTYSMLYSHGHYSSILLMGLLNNKDSWLFFVHLLFKRHTKFQETVLHIHIQTLNSNWTYNGTFLVNYYIWDRSYAVHHIFHISVFVHNAVKKIFHHFLMSPLFVCISCYIDSDLETI